MPKPFKKWKSPWEYTVEIEKDDSSVKPTLVGITRDSPRHGQITLETVNPRKIAVVADAVAPSAWNKVFKKLNISADDYEEFVQWLRKNGLPEHANAHLTHWNPDRELTLPNLNEFDFPIEKPEIDPSLFVDEELSIPDLFEFEIDINKPLFSLPDDINLNDLFQFQPKTKKKQKK